MRPSEPKYETDANELGVALEEKRDVFAKGSGVMIGWVIFKLYNNIILMHLEPKCITMKHKCLSICITPKCLARNPFICDSCEN